MLYQIELFCVFTKQVIIFDMPNSIEEYVHQVGRAGRLHSEGAVMAFINKSNKNVFVALQELCTKSGRKSSLNLRILYL